MRQNPAFDTAKKGSKIEEEPSSTNQQTCRHQRNDYLKKSILLEGKKKAKSEGHEAPKKHKKPPS
jgi:hypothetical protein